MHKALPLTERERKNEREHKQKQPEKGKKSNTFQPNYNKRHTFQERQKESGRKRARKEICLHIFSQFTIKDRRTFLCTYTNRCGMYANDDRNNKMAAQPQQLSHSLFLCLPLCICVGFVCVSDSKLLQNRLVL